MTKTIKEIMLEAVEARLGSLSEDKDTDKLDAAVKDIEDEEGDKGKDADE